MMGSPETEMERDRDENQHEVTVEDFYIGKYEVTVGELRRFIQATGYETDAHRFGGCYIFADNDWRLDEQAYWENVGFEQSSNQPVVCVS